MLPEAYAMFGVVAGVYDYNWKEAEKQFRLAMAHDPIPPRVRQWYGYFHLMFVGSAKESIDQQEQGIKRDPLNVVFKQVPPPDAFVIDGVREMGRDGNLILFEIRRGLDQLMEKAVLYGIKDIETKTVSLEEVFLSFYGPDNKGGKND